MKRIIAVTAVLAALVVLVVVGTGAGKDSSSGYVLRAEFRNAFTVNPGEEVKVAGVAVGKIRALDVTPRQTAVVVMDITTPGFQDFRSDASCTIRPQSLIGERFVECTPTQPRPVGSRPAAPLKTMDIDGQTQHVLPVQNTRKPIDIDLVANTLRLPYRERLSIILGELGAGTAARGSDLRQIIRDGDPALGETDRVLDILKQQNGVLDQLAVDGDRALKPLADNSKSVSDFVDKAGTVAAATAERRTDLERVLQRLPAALQQLQPTMQRLDAFATEATPLVGDLNAAAPQVTRVSQQLGPFAKQATPALQRLGDASEVGRTALLASRPVIQQLRTFANGSKTLASDLSELTTSIKDTGGIDQLLNFVFSSTTSANGYDQFGHYIRANLLLNLCAAYATERDPVCSANYGDAEDGIPRASLSSVLAAATGPDATPLTRTAAVLRGATAKQLLAGDTSGAEATAAATTTETPAAKASGDDGTPAKSDAIALPSQVLPGTADAPTEAPAATTPATPATSTTSTTDGSSAEADGALLDFLLGGSTK